MAQSEATLNAVTVFYRMNPWVQFGFEESHYASYALPDTKGVRTTKIAGSAGRDSSNSELMRSVSRLTAIRISR